MKVEVYCQNCNELFDPEKNVIIEHKDHSLIECPKCKNRMVWERPN